MTKPDNFRDFQQVFMIDVREGEGTQDDLACIVHYFFTKDGQQIGKIDPRNTLPSFEGMIPADGADITRATYPALAHTVEKVVKSRGGGQSKEKEKPSLRKTLSDTQKAIIREMLLKGEKVSAIAAEAECSDQIVYVMKSKMKSQGELT